MLLRDVSFAMSTWRLACSLIHDPNRDGDTAERRPAVAPTGLMVDGTDVKRGVEKAKKKAGDGSLAFNQHRRATQAMHVQHLLTCALLRALVDNGKRHEASVVLAGVVEGTVAPVVGGGGRRDSHRIPKPKILDAKMVGDLLMLYKPAMQVNLRTCVAAATAARHSSLTRSGQDSSYEYDGDLGVMSRSSRGSAHSMTHRPEHDVEEGKEKEKDNDNENGKGESGRRSSDPYVSGGVREARFVSQLYRRLYRDTTSCAESSPGGTEVGPGDFVALRFEVRSIRRGIPSSQTEGNSTANATTNSLYAVPVASLADLHCDRIHEIAAIASLVLRDGELLSSSLRRMSHEHLCGPSMMRVLSSGLALREGVGRRSEDCDGKGTGTAKSEGMGAGADTNKGGLREQSWAVEHQQYPWSVPEGPSDISGDIPRRRASGDELALRVAQMIPLQMRASTSRAPDDVADSGGVSWTRGSKRGQVRDFRSDSSSSSRRRSSRSRSSGSGSSSRSSSSDDRNDLSYDLVRRAALQLSSSPNRQHRRRAAGHLEMLARARCEQGDGDVVLGGKCSVDVGALAMDMFRRLLYGYGAQSELVSSLLISVDEGVQREQRGLWSSQGKEEKKAGRRREHQLWTQAIDKINVLVAAVHVFWTILSRCIYRLLSRDPLSRDSLQRGAFARLLETL